MKVWLITLFVIVSCLFHKNSGHANTIDFTVHSDTIKTKPVKDSIQQVDLIDYLAKLFKAKNVKEKRDNRKFQFSLFPSESGITGGRTVFTSVNVAFLMGDPINTNVSTIFFIPYISFDGRYGLQFRPNIWLKRNSWNFTGEYFILNYPQNTWGLGGNSPEADKTMIDYKQIRFHQNALVRLFPRLVMGLGYAYDYHYDILIEESEAGDKLKASYPMEDERTVSSGVTLPFMIDSRRNSINPERGTFLSLTYRLNSQNLGSTTDWQSLFADARKYFPIPWRREGILALRSFYWTKLSGQVPYLDLPATRWEPVLGSSSRGIAQNRYRSNAMLYFETEYRFGITANGLVGGVIFANLNSASEYGTQQFKYWRPAAGAGIRVKFNKYSRTNVTFDLGFSKEYWTVYVNIGEAF